MRFAVATALMIGTAAGPALAQQARPTQQAQQPQQAPPAPAVADDDAEDVVITARALPGAVVGDIPPENQLGPRAIASYGVGTISELLDQIALQTGSAQGDQGPVILVNGRRVSGVNEISDLPTEAVLRVDILPEEVALKYGYPAEQKVVNVILRRRFRSWVVNAGGGMATAGGGQNATGDLTLTRIRDNDRVNIAARVRTNAALFEDQRGITPSATTAFDLTGNVVAPEGGEIDPALTALAGSASPVSIAGVPAGIANPTLADFAARAGQANVTDDTAERTLRPSQRDYSLNAVVAHALSRTITSSLNFKIDYSTSASRLGLASGTLLLPEGNPFSPFSQDVGVARYFGTDPLDQSSDTTSIQGGATLNADLTQKWRLSLVGGYDHEETTTDVQRGDDLSAIDAALAADDPTVSPYGPALSSLLGDVLENHARSRSDTGNVSALLTGPLFDLPAGPLRTSVRVGGTTSSSSAVTTGAMPVPQIGLGRRTGDGSASFDIPLASKHFVPALGTLTANLNVSRTAISDFETLDGFGYGLNWTPAKPLTLIAAVSNSQRAPSLLQLNSPTILTANVRVFDYVNGTTAMVTRTSGGNPALTADDRHNFKLGGTYKPFANIDLTLSANYTTSRIRNSVGAFPGASASLEAAFPERFTRDEEGDLTAIDTRPVNFARQDVRQLRWGLTFTKTLRQPKRPTPPPGFAARFRRPNAQPNGAGPGPAAEGPQDDAPPPQASPGGAPDAANGASPTGDQDVVITAERENGDNGNSPPAGRQGRFGQGGFGGGRGFGQGGGGFGGGGFGGGGGPGGGRGGGGGFGGGPGGRGDNSARFDLALYHNWTFQDTVLIRDGLPVVDLLSGGTLGGGAMPRHRVDLNTGISDNGVGLRLTGDWQSAATVTGSTSGVGTLHFSSLATFGLRGFINLQQRMPKWTLARGTRISLAVTNVLDTRQKVTNDAGLTPLAYQPGYLDPLGRTVSLSIRKIF